MAKRIFIINGTGGSGKDTFVEIVKRDYPRTLNLSSVGFVKRIAEQCGWDGSKDEKNRKFLSDLKDLLTQWNDVPNKKIDETIKYYCGDNVFIHAREPDNIEYLKNKYDATTLLIINPRIDDIKSNHADADVYDYAYDYIIENSGNLATLADAAKTFMEAINER